MKKKISLVVMALMLILSLAGCGKSKTITYDKAAMQQSCELVFSVVQSGSVTGEQISALSEWNKGNLMNEFQQITGVQMEASSLVTALEGWEAAKEECGEYVSHGDFTFKASSTGVTAETEAEFSDRNAKLEFTFDKNLRLDAFTVGAHYSTGEILQKAGLNTLLGMGTVFTVLIFMCFIISLLKYIPALLEKKGKEEAPKAAAVVTSVPEEEPEMDDTELAAVIAAAIAAAEGTSADGFVVRSIRRRKSNKWNA